MNINSNNERIKKCLDKLGYSFEKQLDSGGFGITYLVKDKNNSKDLYVIKTIKDEHFISDKKELIHALKSIENEVEKLKHLDKHPHIVTIHKLLRESIDLNSQDNHMQSESTSEKLELPFLLMEYIEGEDLKKVVDKRSLPLGEVEALRYISQIGEALICIHNVRLLHRDINPQNIMVRKATNEAVLIDFGIARNFTPEIIKTYTVAGTQRFIAPEQSITKTELGCYTDIYSLAATLYYLLTKNYPYSQNDRRWGFPLIKPKEHNDTISDRVNETILWGMELDFRERPQTVKEWLELLNIDKIKFDAEDLRKSPDELKKAIITHFCPSELDEFLAGFNRSNISYDDLDGKYLHDKVKSLIDQLPEDDDIKTFIEEMKIEKPEAFT